jgi:hypothetical protein
MLQCELKYEVIIPVWMGGPFTGAEWVIKTCFFKARHEDDARGKMLDILNGEKEKTKVISFESRSAT